MGEQTLEVISQTAAMEYGERVVSGPETGVVASIGLGQIVEVARAVSMEVVQANQLMMREMFTQQSTYIIL